MKKIFLFKLLFLVLYSNAQNTTETIVSGKVKNAGGEFVTLIYNPFMRGNISQEGFRNIGVPINKEGEFMLKAENILDGAEYFLAFKESAISNLVLFKDDKINISFDINNPQETLFVTGTGAGKINMMHLPQFKHEFKIEMSVEQYSAYLDSLSSARLTLLDAIYNKEKNHSIIKNAENRSSLERIIDESPLRRKEYIFLKSIIELQKFEIASFIESKSNELEGTIDFSDSYFRPFNRGEYKKIKNVNNSHVAYMLYTILRIEYLKSLKDRELYYENWHDYLSSEEYVKWETKFLKENFAAEVHDRYYVETTSWLISMGTPYQKYEQRLQYLEDNVENKEYLKKTLAFKGLIDNGLTNAEYNLNAENRQLDKVGLENIIEKYKSKNVLLVFWSAEFAGSSIIDQIPSLYYLKEQNDLKIVYIGLDKAELKNLWAARIIDNDWKGEHYFMPVEGNEDSLKKFSSDDIYMFCNGGVTFTFINKNNTISNKIENSFQLSGGKINKYL